MVWGCSETLEGVVRKVIKFVVTMIWQFSRVCAAVIVSFWVAQFLIPVFYSVHGGGLPKINPEPNVCGKISGVTFEFSREYLFFLPDYEGRSQWDPRFLENEQGCNANLSSLSLAMSWPELLPVQPYQVFSNGLDFDGLIVTVRPWRSGQADLSERLDFYLEGASTEERNRVEYVERLGLYYLGGERFLKARSNRGYYWGGFRACRVCCLLYLG